MVVNGKDWMFPSLGLVGISGILGAVEKIDRVPGVPLAPFQILLADFEFPEFRGFQGPIPLEDGRPPSRPPQRRIRFPASMSKYPRKQR